MTLVNLPRGRNARPKKPSWLKVRAPGSPEYMETRKVVHNHRVHTVCEEAMCPNIGECWSHHTATFMIMGDLCTRRCHFCSVKDGTPETLKQLDPEEPIRTGQATAKLGLKHVVITSVNRDDLPDNGASHFVNTVAEIHKHAPGCTIELLIPDLQGSFKDLEVIVKSGITILNHNIETVPRLYRKVRPSAGYIRSLTVLSRTKDIAPNVKTKSGIMVGLGETEAEVCSVMDDLRFHKVDIITIGQYLRPSDKQLPVKEFITPEQFERYRKIGIEKGFSHVESGPFIRSSYHAWKHAGN